MWLLRLLGFVVTVVPHAQQRYSTAGDWQVINARIIVRVSDTGDARCNFLLALHEAVEAWLCQRHGVTQRQVDEFDMQQWPEIKSVYARAVREIRSLYPRQPNEAIVHDEPGEWPFAPYHKEHMLAVRIERMVARLLFVNWQRYEARLEALA